VSTAASTQAHEQQSTLITCCAALRLQVLALDFPLVVQQLAQRMEDV